MNNYRYSQGIKKRKKVNKMKYVVLMNNNYMNSFTEYTKACELRERLERQFKKANITIEIL